MFYCPGVKFSGRQVISLLTLRVVNKSEQDVLEFAIFRLTSNESSVQGTTRSVISSSTVVEHAVSCFSLRHCCRLCLKITTSLIQITTGFLYNTKRWDLSYRLLCLYAHVQFPQKCVWARKYSSTLSNKNAVFGNTTQNRYYLFTFVFFKSNIIYKGCTCN